MGRSKSKEGKVSTLESALGSNDYKVITILRALAISLVLLSHNPFFEFKIGVIGVDIFFLLSGFLISRQIDSMLESSGRKKLLLKFYFRRARRILPSLIASLSIALLLFNVFTVESYYNLVRNSALPALFFYTNFHLISGLTEYFNFTTLNPLSSYWSLSVEEQIYLGLPLLILLLYKLAHRKAIVFLLLLLPSFFFVISDHGSDKYFHPLARLLPFSLGMALVYFPKIRDYIGRIRLRGSVYFILLIAYLLLVKNQDLRGYPDYRVILPLILTSIYISSNLDLARGNRALEYIGLRSFNIYLVYLPISFITPVIISDQKLYFALWLAVSLILGSLLFRLDQFHRKYVANFKKLALYLLANLTIFIGIFNLPHIGVERHENLAQIESYSMLTSNLEYGLNEGFKSQAVDHYHSQQETPNIFTSTGLNYKKTDRCDPLTLCSTASKIGRNNIFILADSSAGPFTPLLAKLAKNNQADLYWFNLTGCDPSGIALDDWNITDGLTTLRCKSFYATLQPTLLKLKKAGQLSIIYQQASSPLRTYHREPLKIEMKSKYYKNVIALLKNYSNNLTLISEVAFNQSDAIECLLRNEISTSCAFSPSDTLNNQLHIENRAIARKLGVSYIDLRDYTCLENRCPVVVNGNLVYRDHLHLTSIYIESISNLIAPLIKLS